LEFCFGGAKPIKGPHDYGTVWQNFSLLLNAIDSEKYLGYTICQACKICQTFCLWAWQAQKGTTHSGSVYSASWGKTCTGTVLPSIGWSGHVQECIAKRRGVGTALAHQMKRKATPQFE